MLFARPGQWPNVVAGTLIAAGALIAAALSPASVLAREPAPAAARLAAADAPNASSASDPHAAGSGSTSCFFRRNWKGGWKTTPDARTIYIEVSWSIYRLDLAGSYRVLRDPWAVLINKDSADTICGPLDLRLTVTNKAGIVQSPIVKKMTRLTPEQAAALPKKLRP